MQELLQLRTLFLMPQSSYLFGTLHMHTSLALKIGIFRPDKILFSCILCYDCF